MKAEVTMTSAIFEGEEVKQLLQDLGIAYTEEKRKRKVYSQMRHQTFEIENDYICVDFETLESLLDFKCKVKKEIIIKDSEEFDFEIEIYDTWRE